MRVLALVVLALIAACGPSSDPPPGDNQGTVVLGLQTPELGSYVGSFRVTVNVNGVYSQGETIDLKPGASTAMVRAYEIRGAVGTPIEAIVEALPPQGTLPVISRRALSTIPAGATRLLRVRLDPRCASIASSQGGVQLGVSCNQPLTCIAGTCAPPEVSEGDLEDFVAGWETAPAPDVCRPAKPGPPEVTLGTGQTDYATLTDGQVLRLEQGPQGGHHVWMAIRMKNLRQSGSTTTVRGVVENGPADVPPLAVVFTFDRDEGSYCKVYGLRFQLDASGLGPNGLPLPQPDKRAFLGKRIVVTAEVVDSTGARASSTRTIQIADKILCADGSERCNDP